MIRSLFHSLKRTHIDTEKEYDDMMEVGEKIPGCPDSPDSPVNRRPHKLIKFEDDLATTRFPRFDIPETELTEISSDEESVNEREEQYRTKEDEDVAVFLDLAERMSLKSLLHLLQGSARAQNLPPECLHQYDTIAKVQNDSILKKNQEAGVTEKPLALPKKFRWAEVSHNEVRTVVHEIESIKRFKNLWWKHEEMTSIRLDVAIAVRHFRKHRPEYINSVQVVAKEVPQSPEAEAVVEQHMKRLTEDSYARGLESHIVKLLSDNRSAVVNAVLEEQDECRASCDDFETTMHCLREQSLAYSQLSTRFAVKMGQCDQIDALKASMSRWRAKPQPGSSDFFGATNDKGPMAPCRNESERSESDGSESSLKG